MSSPALLIHQTMMLIQNVRRAKGLFKVIGALNPACQHWVLTYVSLEISASGLIWQAWLQKSLDLSVKEWQGYF